MLTWPLSLLSRPNPDQTNSSKSNQTAINSSSQILDPTPLTLTQNHTSHSKPSQRRVTNRVTDSTNRLSVRLSLETMKTYLLVFAFYLLHLLPYTTVTAPTTLGVTYSPPLTYSPQPPEKVSAAVAALHFSSVRLPNPYPNLIRSFSYTNISLFLSIPNSFLPALAANKSLTLRWLYGHVLPFHPRSRISLISVGDDAVFSNLSPFLLPAIRNVHLALHELGIKNIAVSTTFSFANVITTPFPPSSATLQEPIGELLIKPLLQFLEDTNSSFLVNVYPYNMYRMNSEIPLGFALFQEQPFYFRDDVITGARYRNLFDMMVDAVITALAVAGYDNMPVVVAETGWPSEPREVDATVAYAEMYLKGLVSHLRSGLGSPLRKGGVAGAYIFELVDKDVNAPPGNKKWGILYANMSNKYQVEFSGSSKFGVGIVFLMGVCLMVVDFLMGIW